jgi:hypothetical protein
VKKIGFIVLIFIVLTCYIDFGFADATDSEAISEETGEFSPCELPDDYPVSLVSVEVDPVYKDMLIPQKTGYLGADGAWSIPLSATKNLWLFGDTLIGSIVDGKRSQNFEFINNSIGIQDFTIPPPNTEFIWDTSGEMAISFFSHRQGTTGKFYWPTMGTVINGELFVFNYSIEMSTDTFIIHGTVLIRVPNPLDPPDKWIQKAYDMGFGSNSLGFHSAMITEKPYIYFIGFKDTETERQAVLARVLIADLVGGKLGDAYEFWVDSPDGPYWGSKPENLIPLFAPGNAETGIHYEPDWDLYFCTTYYPETPEIYLTVAPNLTGPWSEPVCIYQVPEHKGTIAIGSYAVKPHKELSTKPGELIITYVTNANEPNDLFTEKGLGIYYPCFLRVQLELNTSKGE